MAIQFRMSAFLCLGVAFFAPTSSVRADFSSPNYTFTTKALDTNWGYDTTKAINTPPATLWSTYTGPDGNPVVNPANLKNPVQLPQFNANDTTIVAPHDPTQTAVLTGVSIAMSYTLNNTFTYNYTTNSPMSVRADGSIAYTLPSSTPLSFNLPPTFHLGYNPDNTPFYRPFNSVTDKLNQDVTVQNGVVTSFISKTFATNGNDAVSAQYVGNSVLQIPVVAFATSAFDSQSGNGTGRSITDAQFSFQIHYTYKLVPEPSAITLGAIGGMISLMVFARNRQRSSRKTA